MSRIYFRLSVHSESSTEVPTTAPSKYTTTEPAQTLCPDCGSLQDALDAVKELQKRYDFLLNQVHLQYIVITYMTIKKHYDSRLSTGCA